MRFAALRMIFVAALLVWQAASFAEEDGSSQRASDLAAPVRLTALGKPIDVPGFAAPYFADFDGDGLDDLLVGQLEHGRLRIYRNLGTRQQPRFGEFSWFQAGGTIASIPSGCAVGFTPQLIDLDGDGNQEIVTGSFPGGLLFVFARQLDGTFSEAEVITNNQGEVQLTPRRYNSTVFAYDWDQDGDRDLLVGRSASYLIINEGDDAKASYGAAQKITVDGKTIATGRVPPVVADWDADGRDDLIAGEKNDIVWYRNVSSTGGIELERARVLIAASELGPYRDDGPDEFRKLPSQSPYSVCVADFDADGHLDLLLGDHYFLRRNLTDEELRVHRQKSSSRSQFWQSYRDRIKASQNQSRSELVDSFRVALKQWNDLSSLDFDGPQAASIHVRRHGGVWLYRRLAKAE